MLLPLWAFNSDCSHPSLAPVPSFLVIFEALLMSHWGLIMSDGSLAAHCLQMSCTWQKIKAWKCCHRDCRGLHASAPSSFLLPPFAFSCAKSRFLWSTSGCGCSGRRSPACQSWGWPYPAWTWRLLLSSLCLKHQFSMVPNVSATTCSSRLESRDTATALQRGINPSRRQTLSELTPAGCGSPALGRPRWAGPRLPAGLGQAEGK